MSDEDAVVYCPMLDDECAKCCAWYDMERRQCAIVTLAKAAMMEAKKK